MRKPLTAHPFLFTLVPVLRLFAASTDLCTWRVIILPTVMLTCVTVILWFLLTLIVRNKRRAALLVSLVMLLSFSYRDFSMLARWGKVSRGDGRVFLVVWIIVLLVLVFVTAKTRSLSKFTQLLNATALFLVAILVISIVVYRPRVKWAFEPMKDSEQMRVDRDSSGAGGGSPNIYYIILDGYARSDVLAKLYESDNRGFLEGLRRRGFYVASASRCNYPQTLFSLASSLNFQYLTSLAEEVGADCSSRLPLVDMIQNNRLVNLLKLRGYTCVAFSPGIPYMEIRNADRRVRTAHLGEFSNWLISMSVFSELPLVRELQYAVHRDSILSTFTGIGSTCELEPPLLVIAHILAPHPPFVFGPEGEERVPGDLFHFADASDLTRNREPLRGRYRRGYRDQLAYISRMAEQTIDTILSHSRTRPVIILQSDHGPGSTLDWEDPNDASIWERTAILNAYYLPDSGDRGLYDGITPVNTFRIVLNQYFGANLELLEDKSYFSSWGKPYDLLDVTSAIQPSGGDPVTPHEP